MLVKIFKKLTIISIALSIIANLALSAEASNSPALPRNNSPLPLAQMSPIKVTKPKPFKPIYDGGNCGSGVKYNYKASGGLTIFGNGKMTNYNYKNLTPWASYNDLINYIVIENGVTAIGDNAFSDYTIKGISSTSKSKWFICEPIIDVKFKYGSTPGCESLISVIIPESVFFIGKQAFQGCTALPSLDIPKSVTYIGDSAFKDCSSLTSLTYLGKSNPGSNTVFHGCNKLKFVSVLDDYEGDNFCGKPIKRTLAAGTCGMDVEWLLDKTTGKLTISGTGEINDYTANKAPWYSYKNLIKKVELKEGITSIGSNAFSKCSALTSVIIPSSVTSIGKKAFNNCSNLNEVTYFGKSEAITLEKDAFSGCNKLKKVYVPNRYGSGKFGELPVSFIDELSLVAIVKNEAPYIKEWIEYHKLVGVTKFYIYDNESTDNLEETLKDYIKSGEIVYKYFPGLRQQINVYQDALRSCKYKTKYVGFVDIDEFIVPVEKETVVDAIEDIMAQNKKIAGVGINWLNYGSSNFKNKPNGLVTENFRYRAVNTDNYNRQVKTVCNPRLAITMVNAHYLIYEKDYYFVNEEGLKLRDLLSPKVPPYQKLRINHYFTKSKSEYKEKIARGDTIKAKTMADFFARDKNDIYDYIMKKYINQVKNKLNAEASNTVALPPNNPSNFSPPQNSINLDIFKKNSPTNPKKEDLLHVSGKCTPGVTWSFNISPQVFTIYGTGKMPNYNCKNLAPWKTYNKLIKYVVIEDGITSIGENAFSSCTDEISFPPTKPKWFIHEPLIEVKFRYGVTSGCENLAFVFIAESVKSIGRQAFQKCTALTSLTIPKNVTHIGESAFKDCSGLTSLTYLGKANPGNDSVFDCCNKLEYVSVLDDYEGDHFCGKPIKRTLAAGTCGTDVEWLLDKTTGTLTISGTGEIYDYTSYKNAPWSSYKNLIKKVEIKEGITSIGNKTFYKYPSLNSVIIPMSVTSIGKKAFYDCSSLTEVTYFGKNQSIKFAKNTFFGCNKLKKVYVPNSYKSGKFGKFPTTLIDDLSLVAIVKNEAPYIKEWIEFHKLIGVTKFYIYDNESTDNLEETLKDYIKSGEVVYKYFPGVRQQINVYQDALNNYKYKTKYMGFIDIDEFIVPVEKENVVDIIEHIMEKDPKIAGVGVNWLIYGSSGLDDKPNGLVIENYKYRANNNFFYNRHIKTMCNPRIASLSLNPHFLYYDTGYYCVNEQGDKMRGAVVPKASYEKLRLHHYRIKSKAEFLNKKNRGRATTNSDLTLDYFYLYDKNDIYDYVMEKYVEQVKNKLYS